MQLSGGKHDGSLLMVHGRWNAKLCLETRVENHNKIKKAKKCRDLGMKIAILV